MGGAVVSIIIIYHNISKCLNPSSSVPSSMYCTWRTTAGMSASPTTSINDTRNTCPARVPSGRDCINLYLSNESSGMGVNRKSRKNTSHCTEGIRCGAVHIHDADPTCSVVHLSLQIVAHALSNRQSSIYDNSKKIKSASS